MYAKDCSKYTKHVDVAVVQQWQADGIGLLIIQAHPPGYGQERSLEIMRAAQVAGMSWDAYIYQYLAYEDWLPGALATLDLAAAEGLVPRKLWLDVEDVDSGDGWTWQQREAAVQRDLDLCDSGNARAGPIDGPTGIYSAKWYWDAYMGGSTAFTRRELWAAQYDNVADAAVFTPFGGWGECRIKQYAGSQPDGTDLNVLSAQEEQDLMNPDFPGVPPNPIPPDSACDTYKAAIEVGVNRLQIELDRKTTAGGSATLRRKLVKEIQAELFSALSS